MNSNANDDQQQKPFRIHEFERWAVERDPSLAPDMTPREITMAEAREIALAGLKKAEAERAAAAAREGAFYESMNADLQLTPTAGQAEGEYPPPREESMRKLYLLTGADDDSTVLDIALHRLEQMADLKRQLAEYQEMDGWRLAQVKEFQRQLVEVQKSRDMYAARYSRRSKNDYDLIADRAEDADIALAAANAELETERILRIAAESERDNWTESNQSMREERTTESDRLNAELKALRSWAALAETFAQHMDMYGWHSHECLEGRSRCTCGAEVLRERYDNLPPLTKPTQEQEWELYLVKDAQCEHTWVTIKRYKQACSKCKSQRRIPFDKRQSTPAAEHEAGVYEASLAFGAEPYQPTMSNSTNDLQPTLAAGQAEGYWVDRIPGKGNRHVLYRGSEKLGESSNAALLHGCAGTMNALEQQIADLKRQLADLDRLNRENNNWAETQVARAEAAEKALADYHRDFHGTNTVWFEEAKKQAAKTADAALAAAKEQLDNWKKNARWNQEQVVIWHARYEIANAERDYQYARAESASIEAGQLRAELEAQVRLNESPAEADAWKAERATLTEERDEAKRSRGVYMAMYEEAESERDAFETELKALRPRATLAEELLREIWAADAAEDYFEESEEEYGGHALAMRQVYVKVRDFLGIARTQPTQEGDQDA